MSIDLPKRREQIQEILRKHKPLLTCLACELEPRLGYQTGNYDGEMKMPFVYPVGAFYELFTLFCPKCGFRCGPHLDLQAVVTSWHRSNTRNSEHHVLVWSISYETQMTKDNKPEAA